MKKILLSIFVLMISPSILAQDIDGSWSATIDTPHGPVNMVFNLTSEGNRITGTMANIFVGIAPISDGSLVGKDVSFKATMESQEGAMIAVYKGTFEGDVLNLMSTFEGDIIPGTPQRQAVNASRSN